MLYSIYIGVGRREKAFVSNNCHSRITGFWFWNVIETRVINTCFDDVAWQCRKHPPNVYEYLFDRPVYCTDL